MFIYVAIEPRLLSKKVKTTKKIKSKVKPEGYYWFKSLIETHEKLAEKTPTIAVAIIFFLIFR